MGEVMGEELPILKGILNGVVNYHNARRCQSEKFKVKRKKKLRKQKNEFDLTFETRFWQNRALRLVALSTAFVPTYDGTFSLEMKVTIAFPRALFFVPLSFRRIVLLRSQTQSDREIIFVSLQFL